MNNSLVLPFRAPPRFVPGRPVIRVSPGGTRVFVSSDQFPQWAIVLEVPSGKPLGEFSDLGRGPQALFLDEDRLLVFREEGNTVYDLPRGQALTWDGDPIPGSDGWLGPRPNVIVTGGNRLGLYDIAARKTLRLFPHLIERYVHSVGLSPDGRYLAAEFGEKDSRCTPLVGVWDLTSGRRVRIYEIFSDNESQDIALSSEGLFAVCTNGFVDVFGPDHTESIGRVYDCLAKCLRFTDSGRVLEVVEYDGAVAWVDPRTGEALRKEPPPAEPRLNGCAVNGSGLAAGVAERDVLVWQLPRWEGAAPGAGTTRSR